MVIGVTGLPGQRVARPVVLARQVEHASATTQSQPMAGQIASAVHQSLSLATLSAAQLVSKPLRISKFKWKYRSQYKLPYNGLSS